ncbi:hypothetical protein ERO13_A02G175150v2 [Gossypium hirsutum]|nr:hypothetical protein ERO13_A02G175150v2 [Gossypium hirsutum]
MHQEGAAFKGRSCAVRTIFCEGLKHSTTPANTIPTHL